MTLEVETRALCILGKHSTLGPHALPLMEFEKSYLHSLFFDAILITTGVLISSHH
jgi:hypothetical protein